MLTGNVQIWWSNTASSFIYWHHQLPHLGVELRTWNGLNGLKLILNTGRALAGTGKLYVINSCPKHSSIKMIVQTQNLGMDFGQKHQI